MNENKNNQVVVVENNNSVSLVDETYLKQLETVKNTILPKSITNEEFLLFAKICKERQLDPFSRQVYGLSIGGKLSIMISIDGFRLIASRTGNFDHSIIEFCGADKVWTDVWLEKLPPKAARCKVMKKDAKDYTTRVVLWDEYARYEKDKYGVVGLGYMWKKMPTVMLGKCSEAVALRTTFPAELQGLYSVEEMDRARSENNIKVDNNKIVEVIPNDIDNTVYDKNTDTYHKDYRVHPKTKIPFIDFTDETLIVAFNYYANNENCKSNATDKAEYIKVIKSILASRGFRFSKDNQIQEQKITHVKDEDIVHIDEDKDPFDKEDSKEDFFTDEDAKDKGSKLEDDDVPF